MMWTAKRRVEHSVRELGLADRLRAVDDPEAEALYDEIEVRFSARKGARWLWEHLRDPVASRRFRDDRAYERFARIVPSASDDLLFFPGSDGDSAFAFRGAIDVIAAVIGECSHFEYIIAPPTLQWLLCENHHNVLIAAGEPVASRLRALAECDSDEPHR